MTRLLRSFSALACLLATQLLHGQLAGAPFAVTNTRYGTAPAVPLLRDNGQDFFLFWLSDGKVLATKVLEGRDRVGHLVLDASEDFDVAWVGGGFLAVAQQADGTILARRLDAHAKPAGLPFPMAGRAHNEVRLAASGDRALMAYKAWNEDWSRLETHVVLLTSEGQPAGMSGVLVGNGQRTVLAGDGSGFLLARKTEAGIVAAALDRDGFVATYSILGQPPASYDDDYTLAAGTSGYLLAWVESGKLLAVPMSSRGAPGSTLTIEPHEGESFRDPSAAWNGNGWSIGYEGASGKAEVTHLDAAVQRETSREQSGLRGFAHSLRSMGGRMFLASRAAGTLAAAQITPLPFEANGERDATFTATRQTLLATTSSANATLVVWRELGDGKASIRAGVRTHNGHWSEREIASDEVLHAPWEPTVARAASNGVHFVVLIDRITGVEAIRLDETGRALGPAVRISDERHAAIAWNGQVYGIVTDEGGRLLTSSGALSALVPMSTRGDWVRSLASNGAGFLLTTGQTACYIMGFCQAEGLFATRLGPDLQRLENTDLVLADPLSATSGFGPDLVWNGSEYLALWGSSPAWMARISPSVAGAVAVQAVDLDISSISTPAVSSTGDGGLALVNRGVRQGQPNDTLIVINREGSVVMNAEIHRAPKLAASGLAPLPGGRLAYVVSRVSDDAPQHGSSHVFMAITGQSLQARPTAPRVSITESDTRWSVAWQPSAGTVNGYRLEYRIDDGAWIELERWFTPAESGIPIRKPATDSTVSVRMRAFNDSGTSEYSEIAVPRPVRRRAVR